MFHVEFYKKAHKDLRALNDHREINLILDLVERELCANPFPSGKVKKKLKGMTDPIYRLRIDTKKDTYRIFYCIRNELVIVLRVVKKKDADRTLNNLSR